MTVWAPAATWTNFFLPICLVIAWYYGRLIKYVWPSTLVLCSAIYSIYYHMCWNDSTEGGMCFGARELRTDLVPAQWTAGSDGLTYADIASQQIVSTVLAARDVMAALQLAVGVVSVMAHALWWEPYFGDATYTFRKDEKVKKADIWLAMYLMVGTLFTQGLVTHFGLTWATTGPLMGLHGITFACIVIFAMLKDAEGKPMYTLWWRIALWALTISGAVAAITLRYLATTSSPDNLGLTSVTAFQEHAFWHVLVGLTSAFGWFLAFCGTAKEPKAVNTAVRGSVKYIGVSTGK